MGQIAERVHTLLQHPIARGQLVSVLIAGTGLTSSLLAHRGTNFPTFQSFFNYALLSLYLFQAKVDLKNLRVPWYYYLMAALIDLEANFLVVKAYQYTSITSVMLLDCFSIPCAMVLSRIFLSAKYNLVHVAGVIACVVGLVCIVLSDIHEGSDGGYRNALLGDVLCLCGAMLYGTSNVLQEFLVKNHSRHEFLGMMGAFGTVASLVQSMALEYAAIGRGSNHGWDITTVALLVGFVGFLYLMYTQTSLFLCTGDAALFNLSLLTSDLYAVLFAFLIYGYLVGWMYALALVFIAIGIYVYHSQPPPNPVPFQQSLDEESFGESGDSSPGRSPATSSLASEGLLAYDSLVEPGDAFVKERQ